MIKLLYDENGIVFDINRFKNPRTQAFALPQTIINYWLENPTSAGGLENLQKCCKYFYSKKKIIFLKGHSQQRNVGGIDISQEYEEGWKEVQFWITDYLDFFIDGTLRYFPQQIYRCTVVRLSLCWSTILYADFQLITKENTIQDFHSSQCFIVYSNDADIVPLDEIFALLPNLRELYWFFDYDETVTKIHGSIKRVKFWNKIKKFYLRGITTSDFKPKALCEFINNNADSLSIIRFHINPEHALELKNEINVMKEKQFEDQNLWIRL